MFEESIIKLLSYDQWLEINEEELYISAAESGADREYDYDAEAYAEACYEEYCKESTHE